LLESIVCLVFIGGVVVQSGRSPPGVVHLPAEDIDVALIKVDIAFIRLVAEAIGPNAVDGIASLRCLLVAIVVVFDVDAGILLLDVQRDAADIIRRLRPVCQAV